MTDTAFSHACPICGSEMVLVNQTKEIEGRPTLRRAGIYACQGCDGEWQLTVMMEPVDDRTSRRWSMALRDSGLVR